MPEKATVERAKEDLREGKAPTTAAGEFVREEVEHVRHGKHGVRSPQQAIAIGLSKARRAGVPLAPPKPGRTSESTRRKAERDYERGTGRMAAPKKSARRSRAREEALQREPRSTASRSAMSQQTKKAAKKRGSASRKAAAKKAVRTKGKSELRSAAKKAARTRRRSTGSRRKK